MARSSLIASMLASSGMKGVIDALNKIELALRDLSLYTEIYNETPGGSINSANKIFTVAETPADDSLQLYLSGMFMTPGDDYTITNKTITFVNAPFTGSNLRAFYKYERNL